MRKVRSIRYYPRFPEAVPVRGAGCPRVTQPFATVFAPEGALTVRLACVRRAASVHPEPGSNSPFGRAPPRGRPFKLNELSPSPRPIRIASCIGFAESWNRWDPIKSCIGSIRLRLSVSSTDLSIAVSGSQGPPRGAPELAFRRPARRRARNKYTHPAGPAQGARRRST